MEESFNRSLIVKFLTQQCTEAEKQIFLHGIDTPEGKQLFDEVMLERWNQTGVAEDISNFQLSAWHEKIHQRIEAAGAAKKPVRLLRTTVLRYAGISTGLVMGLVVFNLLKTKKAPVADAVAIREIINPYGKRSIVTLPDSSVVYLGAGSKIRFQETFADNSRDITLEGEAYFEVKHKSRQAFIVHTGTLQTRDIGTAFKITAFKNHPVTIALASGKVRIERLRNHKIQVLANLVPGQQSTWDNETLTTSSTPVDDIVGWKDGRLVFEETPLKQLTTVLERWYNVKFQYKNSEKPEEKISVVLQADVPLEKIMNVLCATAHFKYSIQGQNIIIR